ncbi:TSUP family transporter [Streptomyces luteogriseus]|uniref:TSUP family transporter n=1 Tax=Streptomyces luteogriseus TaxID=68233 RepID=UPI0037BBC691
MEWTVWAGLASGLLIAVVTAPVGVSGAVFLLPVHLSVFGVPSPAITPTNLLFNVVAGPGALWRYRRDGALRGGLARRLAVGTLPGVVLGAAIRVFALPGPGVFRLLIAILLLPLGLWLCVRTLAPARHRPDTAAEPSPAALTALALGVGVIGGIYGIGGGSLLGPVLAARGLPMTGDVAPDWWLGLSCEVGGLVGGYLGARLQPRLPENALRLLLGVLATSVGGPGHARAPRPT